MFPGAGERGHCTSGMFAGGASDPPVCANDLCRDTAFPFKHPAVDVCYNAEGYEDYLKKGWSSCGTWCENTKGAGWQGCDANPPACNKCADHPTYKHYHDWALHTWHQPLQVCYNDEGWSQLNSRGYGDCGTLCALPGTCPGGSCHGCSGVPECEAVYFAASSTAPPSGGRRLFEPDKPCDTAELAEMQTADSVGCGAEPVKKSITVPAMSCEDAADDAVAALIAELDLPYASCAELRTAGECDRAIVKKHCPASCDACACEDAADELVAKITREVFGRAVASCAALRSIRKDFGGAGGACDHELAVKYCPATCGRCDVEAPSDRHGGRGLNDKCIST